MPPPALQAAVAVVAGRDLLPRLLAVLGAALAGLLLLVIAPLTVVSSGGGTASAPAGIPPRFIAVYREAARVFGVDWLVLASVHAQETGFSEHPTTYGGLNAAGCCGGPFQINVTNGPPSTWDRVRNAYRLGQRPEDYPHAAAPHPSIYDDFDAAMAAAALLRANGADATLGPATWNAVRAYNGSGPAAIAYADAVITRARAWAQAPAPMDGGGSGALAWPVRGPITSPFCERRAWEACHPGIDIAVPSGTPVLAAANGRVTLVQPTGASGGYGNFTCLAHSAAVSSCYAHQQSVLVHPGQLVTRGQRIGVSDCTGRCTGPHLHFEVRVDDRAVCPAAYLAAPRSMCATGAAGQ